MGLFASIGAALAKKKHPPKTAALILAAGSGERFRASEGAEAGSGASKQFRTIGGVPVLALTMRAFEACGEISEIIVATGKDDLGTVDALADRYSVTKYKKAVAGGGTRQESSLAAFEAISDDVKYVAVHDAARCCIAPADISAVLADAYHYGCAAAGHKATDTVKIEDGRGFIAKTEDRDRVWLVATPQVFRTEIYRASAYLAKQSGKTYTDDCGMAEAQNFRIRLTDVGNENIKITTAGDLDTAARILERRTDQ